MTEQQSSFADLCDVLDPKEQAFVDEYLECLNATLAARRVWGNGAARQHGHKALHRPDVAAAIAAGRREQAERTNNDPDRIIRELMMIAFADPQDLLDETGKPLALRELPPDIRRTIASLDIKVKDDGARVLKYKFWSKPQALELLGKRNKMWTDRKELDVSDSLAALIAKAFDRPKPEPTPFGADTESLVGTGATPSPAGTPE